MPDGYNFAAFGSTNPALADLFKNEFAARQGAQQAAQAQAAQETARRQIAAQSQLAQAQQQANIGQQQYSNLFKEREFQAREEGDKVKEGQANRLLDIQEKAYGVKPGEDIQRRKQAIIDANSTAINDAQRANALYKIELESQINSAKQGLSWFGQGLRGGHTAAGLADPNSPEYRTIQKGVFDTIRGKLLAEKGGALNNLVPDDQTFTFKPIQFDETGKAIALPLPSPGSSANPAALGTPPKTGYDTSGNADAPGGTLSNPAALGPAPSAMGRFFGPFAGGSFTAAPAGAANPAALGPSVPVRPPSTMDTMLGPFAGGTYSGATPPSPAVAAPALIRIPIAGLGLMELSPVDASEAERQLRSVPPEQAPATAAAIRDSLIKSGRARIVAPTP